MRQQAAVVVQRHRQFGQQGAGLEGALRSPQLGGQAQLAVFVLGAIGLLAVGLQQASAGAVGAGVQLDPEQAEGVHTHADCAVGVAGLVAQQEALGPLLRLALGGAVLAEVAVEVEVAQFQVGLAVGEEVGEDLGGEAEAEAQRGDNGGMTERGTAHREISWRGAVCEAGLAVVSAGVGSRSGSVACCYVGCADGAATDAIARIVPGV
ncbi:hypothetical protein D9M70_475800 [compost metagenome]